MPVVKVENRPWGQDRVVPRPGGSDCAVEPTPGHDRGRGRDSALQDLIPTDEPATVGGEMFFDALDEIALQSLLVGDMELSHPRLNPRRSLPLVLHSLVASDMEVLSGKESHHFIANVIQKVERA